MSLLSPTPPRVNDQGDYQFSPAFPDCGNVDELSLPHDANTFLAWAHVQQAQSDADDDLRNQVDEAEQFVGAIVPDYRGFTISQSRRFMRTRNRAARETIQFGASIVLPTTAIIVGFGPSPLAAAKAALMKLPPGLIVDLAA